MEGINMKKAMVKYSGKLMLIIPKNDKASLLFLEWLSKENDSKKGILYKIIEYIDKEKNKFFKISMNVEKDIFLNAAEYINQKL
jgi:hypothetical protein